MGIHDRDYYQDDQIRPLRPWDGKSMVTLLIVANVILFLANFLLTGRENLISGMLALQPDDLTRPLNWYRLLTYGFVHSGITHILFNMLALYFLGQAVEDKYGKWEFFRIYMVTILLCGIVWCLLRLNEGGGPAMLVGASGGTTAIAMLFVFSFPQSTLYLYGVLPVKAWVLGILIVLGNIFGGSAQTAYDVHLVGVGVAAAYFYGGFNLRFLDFSFLTGFTDGVSRKIKQKRSGLRVHQPGGSGRNEEPDLDPEQIEADRILEKIHAQGQSSLTSKEQRFMERYSRRVRERRGQ